MKFEGVKDSVGHAIVTSSSPSESSIVGTACTESATKNISEMYLHGCNGVYSRSLESLVDTLCLVAVYSCSVFLFCFNA